MVYTKEHHCYFSPHLREDQLLMSQVQAVLDVKVFEGFAIMVIQPPLLTRGIQLIPPWFRKASRFTSCLQLNPPATHTEVLPLQFVSPVPMRDPFPTHGLHSQEQL